MLIPNFLVENKGKEREEKRKEGYKEFCQTLTLHVIFIYECYMYIFI